MPSEKPEIRLRGKKFEFSVPLGDGPVVPTAGGARIEEVTRPERPGLTVYEGDDLIRVDVPVFWNGWPKRDISAHRDQVLNLCEGRNGNPPPDFTASGPMPYSGMRFMMAGLPEWGEERSVRINNQIRLVRQKLTLKLVQFEDPDAIRFRRDKGPQAWRGSAKSGGTSAPPHKIVTREGETLLQIAADVFGDPSRAKDIGKLNDIRDVRKKLPAGKTIVLPAD